MSQKELTRYEALGRMVERTSPPRKWKGTRGSSRTRRPWRGSAADGIGPR